MAGRRWRGGRWREHLRTHSCNLCSALDRVQKTLVPYIVSLWILSLYLDSDGVMKGTIRLTLMLGTCESRFVGLGCGFVRFSLLLLLLRWMFVSVADPQLAPAARLSSALKAQRARHRIHIPSRALTKPQNTKLHSCLLVSSLNKAITTTNKVILDI